jgi:chromosomal replication initiation ATPase DnaA
MTATTIIDVACRVAGVSFLDLCAPERSPQVVRARRLTAYLLRTHWPLGSFPSISRAMGKEAEAHASCQGQYSAAVRLIESDPDFAAMVRRAEAGIQERNETA